MLRSPCTGKLCRSPALQSAAMLGDNNRAQLVTCCLLEWDVTKSAIVLCWETDLLCQREGQNHESSSVWFTLISHSARPVFVFFFKMNKRDNEWDGELLISQKEPEKHWAVESQEAFFFTLTHKHSKGSIKAPLTAKRLRLRMELSRMVMRSVWIILGSQTEVLFRLHLPLLFTSMLHPLMTSWRSARLYIMSNTPDSWIQETYVASCSSHAWMLQLITFACSCLIL